VVRSSLQEELLSLQRALQKTILFVTHDIEEAIKIGDLVALFRPHGKIAQFDTPERLLGAPADDYVAGFVGFDRGIRRLSFFRSQGLSLSTGPVLSDSTTVAKAQAVGEPWILVTDGGKPRGWVEADSLGSRQGDSPLSQVPAEPFGHTFTVGTDSLRAALDAAVLSPAGQAVGVDDDGQAVGVATFDQLRAAIQAAEKAADEDGADNSKKRAERAEPAPSQPGAQGAPSGAQP
jgi:osmoprotectant transport system ATP-binding protein